MFAVHVLKKASMESRKGEGLMGCPKRMLRLGDWLEM